MVKVVNGSGSSLNGDVNNSKIKLRGPPPFDNGTVTCMHVMRRVGLAMQGRRSCSNAEKDTVFESERKIVTDESCRRRLTPAYNSLTKVPSKSGA